MSILPFLRRILRDDDILVLCRVLSVRLFVDQRMLEEVHVVALREIAARVSAAALLARRCPLHDGMGDLQEIAELDVLLECGVVDMGAVADIAVLVVLLECAQFL